MWAASPGMVSFRITLTPRPFGLLCGVALSGWWWLGSVALLLIRTLR